jgi:hypothetical protein
MSVLAIQKDRGRPPRLFVDCAPKATARLQSKRGHSTALFACECQSFLDNFIALGFCWRRVDRSRRRWKSPSHGENRGSSPLGSANDFRDLVGATHTNEGRCLLFVYYSI